MNNQFLLIFVAWILLLLISFYWYWRRRQLSSGVVFTYILLLTSSHAIQGLVYSFPWYQPFYPTEVVLAGFQQSLIALTGFIIGALILQPALHRFNANVSIRNVKPPSYTVSQLPNLIPVYIAIGFFAYFVLGPLFASTPTISSFILSLQRLFHIGIMALMWRYATQTPPNRLGLLLLGIAIVVWPLVTIINDGFLSFGLYPTIFVLTFALLRFGKLSTLIVIVPIIVYLGLSVVTTYFSGRSELRSVIWSSEDMELRIATTTDVFTTNFQLFDIYNPTQLEAFDVRLSLNRLIGLGVQRLETGVVDYSYGKTIADAMLMVVPRIFWTDKPLIVGGQALVNQYTGVYMMGSTSVALGHVLEFYVNFGTVGVFTGFLGLGTLLALIDERAAVALNANNLFRTTLWLMPSFGLWLIEDNLITTVGTSVSALLTTIIVHFFFRMVQSKHASVTSTKPFLKIRGRLSEPSP